jgi:HSP20 family protein
MAKGANVEKSRATTIAPLRPLLTEPFRELERMRREMDRWFGFPEMPERRAVDLREWFPDFDLSETENELILRAEMPGIDPKDIDIALVNNTLRIKGEKKQEMEEKDENYHFVGRSYGTFARSIPLPTYVKSDNIQATYKDGVLKIVLPKSEEAKQKQIHIRVEGESQEGKPS